MTERNPYSPYSYDSFDQRKDGPRLTPADGFKERAMSRISTPVFATAALLLTGAAFAGIIIASYPSSDAGPPQPVPVIKADAENIRIAPSENADASVFRQDSAVFATAQPR
jgi:hypothetical protein